MNPIARGRNGLVEDVLDTGRSEISQMDWDHTIGVRLFHEIGRLNGADRLPKFEDVASPAWMPGCVFQAARQLCGLSQRELSETASVSKKSINDFENGLAPLGPRLVERLVVTLRENGVRFVGGEGVVGVVVVRARRDFEETSRSPRRSAPPR